MVAYGLREHRVLTSRVLSVLPDSNRNDAAMRFASSVTAAQTAHEAAEGLLAPMDARLTPGMVDLALLFTTADFNADGLPDLVVANYRSEFEYDTDSFVYWGNGSGFDADRPLHLPTHCALQVLLADLNDDGFKEIIFCGGNQVQIYWNDRGRFDPGSIPSY